MWGVNFGATRRILLNNPWVVAIMRLPIATDIARSVVSVYVSYVCGDHDREPYKTDESMGDMLFGDRLVFGPRYHLSDHGSSLWRK